MRQLRILVFLTLIIFLPSTLVAAPRSHREVSGFERAVSAVKRFIAHIQSKITIPIGETDGGDDTPPPPPPPPPSA